MAINKNHLFEDLEGVKCAIVEAGVAEERMQFLKSLLEFNGYTVVIVAEAEKKTAAPVVTPATEPAVENTLPPAPEIPAEPKYKIGVTDVTFNATNAIFGRVLKTRDGRIVTMAYWLQKENVSRDDVPYFEKS